MSSSSSTSSSRIPSTAATAASYAANATVPITTTITSVSSICVATLEGQILNAGVTAVIYNTDGEFITLNKSCHSTSMTATSSEQGRTTSGTTQRSSTASQDALVTQHRNVLSAGTIAGLVIGIVAVLFAIAGFACWLRYRRRSRMTVITMPAKTLDEDASDQISIRWEKDGAEITEMSAVRAPVEIGDARSIRKANGSNVELGLAISPVSPGQGKARGTELGEIVSPLSPLNPQ